MPIKFRCEHCRQLLGISQSKAGESVDCPTCGRSVRVPTLDGKSSPPPVPKMNLQDNSLLDALDALASLGKRSNLSRETSSESATIENLHDSEAQERGASGVESTQHRDRAEEPRPVPLPEAVVLPPLEQPVVLDEPEPVNEPSEESRSENSRSLPEQDPLVELASLANRPSPSRELAPVSQSNSWSVLAFVSCLSFLAGFLVRAQFFTNAPSHMPRESHQAENDVDKNDRRQNESPSVTDVSKKRAVEGRITYRTGEGNSKPDAGATVILLPASRSSSVKLPIVGFRPADHQEDREVARAAVKALGGDVCLVDDEGRFAAQLDQSGNYHVLVLSHTQERAAADVRLPEGVKTVLLNYFDRPEQLPGRRRYHLGYVYYRGESTEIWDYSFERI